MVRFKQLLQLTVPFVAHFCNKICPLLTHAPQQTASLFDDLVGAGEQSWRDFKPDVSSARLERWCALS
jgi:hypothetical protein